MRLSFSVNEIINLVLHISYIIVLHNFCTARGEMKWNMLYDRRHVIVFYVSWAYTTAPLYDIPFMLYILLLKYECKYLFYPSSVFFFLLLLFKYSSDKRIMMDIQRDLWRLVPFKFFRQSYSMFSLLKMKNLCEYIN